MSDWKSDEWDRQELYGGHPPACTCVTCDEKRRWRDSQPIYAHHPPACTCPECDAQRPRKTCLNCMPHFSNQGAHLARRRVYEDEAQSPPVLRCVKCQRVVNPWEVFPPAPLSILDRLFRRKKGKDRDKGIQS